MIDDNAVTASLTFMAPNALHNTHRPYELLYQTERLLPGCNYDEIEHQVELEDFRPLKGKLSLDREGFLLVDLDSAMKYEDFFDQDTLKEKYMAEVKYLIISVFRARSVYFHECVVSLSLGVETERWD